MLPCLMQAGYTALHWASMKGHLEVAKALLEKGAATDLTDNVSLLCIHAIHAKWCVWFRYMALYTWPTMYNIILYNSAWLYCSNCLFNKECLSRVYSSLMKSANTLLFT